MRKFFSLITALVLCTAMWGDTYKTFYKVQGALYQGINVDFTTNKNMFVPNGATVTYSTFDGKPADWYNNGNLKKSGVSSYTVSNLADGGYYKYQIKNYTGYDAQDPKIDYMYGTVDNKSYFLRAGSGTMYMMSMANAYCVCTESSTASNVGKYHVDNRSMLTLGATDAKTYGTSMKYGTNFSYAKNGGLIFAYEMLLDNPGEMYIDYIVLPIFGYPKSDATTIAKMIPEGKELTLTLYSIDLTLADDGKYTYTRKTPAITSVTATAENFTQGDKVYDGTVKFTLDEPLLISGDFVARLTWDDGCEFGLITDDNNLQNFTTFYLWKDEEGKITKSYFWVSTSANASISYHAMFPVLEKKDTKTALEFTHEGGGDEVAIKSNIDPASKDFTIDFGGADWISLDSLRYTTEGEYKAKETVYVVFKAEANTGEAREATIILKHHGKELTYTVSQEAAPAPVEPTNLYLKAGEVDYMKDGAVVYLYSWGGSSEADWSKFELIQNETTAKASMMKDRTGMKIVRFASGTTTPSWQGTIWNQTGDIAVSSDFPEKVDMIELSAWDGATAATWSKYTKPAVITYKDSVYYVAGNFTKWAAEMKKLPAEVELPADSALEFKQVLTRTVLADGDSVRQDTIWYGQPNKGNFMTRDNSTWKLDGAENVLAMTDLAGTYTFSLNEKGEFVLGWPELPAEGLPQIIEAPKSWAGEYVITAMKDENTALVWTGVDAGQCRVEAPVADNKLTNNDFVKVIVEALQEGGYSIKVKGGTNDGKYITQKAKPDYNNALSFVDTPVRVDIEMNENGLIDIYQTVSATQKVYLLYNAQSGSTNERFRFYKGSNYGGANYKSLTLFGTVAPEPIGTFDLTIVQDTLWSSANAKIAAWIWGKELEGEWTAWATNKNDTLTLKVNEKADSIIFKRFAPEVEVPYWEGTAEYQWNEIAKSEIEDCHLFIITNWNEGVWCERPQPVETKYYVTGNAALVGTEKAWKADALEMNGTTYTFTALPAGDYKMKVTNGTWDKSWGYSDLSTTAPVEGLTTDEDNNICFTVYTPNDVTVTISEGHILIINGNFKPEPAATFDLTIVQDTLWSSANAKIAAWIWGKELEGEWTAWATNKNDTLTLKVNEKADSIIFKRFAPEVEVPYWEGTAEYQWNEIAKSEIADCHLFIITNWNEGVWCERPQPVETKYYITGNAALVGEDKAWNAQAIEMTDSAYVFTELAAGEYEMKITNGAWDPEGQSWGSAALSEECSAGVGDKSGNIYFVVETANDVTVSIANGKVTVIGTFKQVATGITVNVTVPEGTPACFFYGEMSGNTFVEMTKVDETHYTIDFPKATTIGWGYKFVWENGNWSTCNADPEGDIKIEPVNGVITVEVKAWATAPGTEYKYTTYTEWQVKFGPAWEWVNMTKQEDGTFTVEAVWGNTGINIASGENPIKKDWYPLGDPALTVEEGVVEGGNVVITLTVVDDETVALNVKKGQEPATPDFGLLVNGTNYLAGTPEDKDTYTEYAVSTTLAVGDFVQLYDNVNKAAWTVTPEGSGFTDFEMKNDAYYIKQAGLYQFYIKIPKEGMESGLYVSFQGSGTGLNNVKALDGKRYNILGQSVNETYRGIVIMNGQTYLQ